MIPRPTFRMRLWVPFAILLAAYVARSLMRGVDFRPDLPMDAVVLALTLVVAGVVAWVRYDDARLDNQDDDATNAPGDPGGVRDES